MQNAGWAFPCPHITGGFKRVFYRFGSSALKKKKNDVESHCTFHENIFQGRLN